MNALEYQQDSTNHDVQVVLCLVDRKVLFLLVHLEAFRLPRRISSQLLLYLAIVETSILSAHTCLTSILLSLVDIRPASFVANKPIKFACNVLVRMERKALPCTGIHALASQSLASISTTIPTSTVSDAVNTSLLRRGSRNGSIHRRTRWLRILAMFGIY
jgi:hypothetical protein